MTKYWLSCSRFTIQVNTDDNGIIVWTAPIARKFVGQPFQNLVRWSKADQVCVINSTKGDGNIEIEKPI